MGEIAVSIICNTYNHEKYIADALNGFIMQRTNFQFEILIHDDASTDKTADIIREYEKKYPDIVKPIYQTENQYSKNVSIGRIYQSPRIKGRYIAICEGDDYWIDPYKLQKQFDAMEKHPEIDVCAHTAVMVEEGTKKVIKKISASRKTTVIPTEKVIAGGGGFVATNSLFYRVEIEQNIPAFRNYFPFDYALQIHLSLRGGMLYLRENMSAYRRMSRGSWSERMRDCKSQSIKHNEKVLKMCEMLNEETCYKYSKTIEKHMVRIKSEMVYSKLLDHESLNDSDYDVVKKTNLKWKMKILLQLKFPELTNKLKQIKRNIWK